MEREQQVSRAFLSLADTLADGVDPLVLLQRLVEHCTRLLDVDAVGVTMRDVRGGMRTMAASSEEARLLEMLQLQNNDGPCFAAYREHRSMALPDLAGERDRWPEIVPAVLNAGFASMHVVPLRLHDRTVGSVNHFRARRGGLSLADQELARALADATMFSLMHWSRERVGAGELMTRLQGAIAAKASLEIAKGMLANYAGVGFPDAARALAGYAARYRVRPTETAEALVRRDLPLDAVIGPRTEPAHD
jgi:GAF domain-containing protein